MIQFDDLRIFSRWVGCFNHQLDNEWGIFRWWICCWPHQGRWGWYRGAGALGHGPIGDSMLLLLPENDGRPDVVHSQDLEMIFCWTWWDGWGGEQKLCFMQMFWYFQECKRSEHVAILVVRTRKRQVRRVETEMEMTQRCHLWALFVACQGFSCTQKNREATCFSQPCHHCGANLTNWTNGEAVSAKPRSFSFATQLHTTSPPLRKCRHVCAFRVSFGRFGKSRDGLGRAFAFGWIGGALTTSGREWYPFLCGKARVFLLEVSENSGTPKTPQNDHF